ncbi:hypothetical protein BS50DRAFT_314401 [Corynespora cassiicola Philippines]|uniref:Uncharacterized protein n=1 Tax=Corynespora cassiicola Philippines TaxID=1448308 RepID=A0A2T2NYN2_CORCC|nr:hypothetical protein BS50DRAFT_314401 [Corynespora cassiicola Philippines]
MFVALDLHCEIGLCSVLSSYHIKLTAARILPKYRYTCVVLLIYNHLILNGYRRIYTYALSNSSRAESNVLHVDDRGVRRLDLLSRGVNSSLADNALILLSAMHGEIIIRACAHFTASGAETKPTGFLMVYSASAGCMPICKLRHQKVLEHLHVTVSTPGQSSNNTIDISASDNAALGIIST